MIRLLWLVCVPVVVLVASPVVVAEDTVAGTTTGFTVSRIWNQGKHNAFTDLVRYREAFYCTFRESGAHVPRNHAEDGTVRVLRSADGTKWESVALLKDEGVDLRDPKLSVTPDDRLMVIMGGSYYESSKLLKRVSRVAFYEGRSGKWTGPIPVKIDKSIRTKLDWLWRVTWHGNSGYGVVYQPIADSWGLHLVKTTDGIHYSLAQTFDLPGKPNESTVRFASDGEMWIVVRNEDGKPRGHLGRSMPPYKTTRWVEIPQRLGGPNHWQLPGGTWVLGSRDYGTARTTSVSMLRADGRVKKIATFPSGGDTSYPGLLVHQGKLWVSYYSSHEGKTSIYLALVPLEQFKN